jgi:hypothetical protein
MNSILDDLVAHSSRLMMNSRTCGSSCARARRLRELAARMHRQDAENILAQCVEDGVDFCHSFQTEQRALAAVDVLDNFGISAELIMEHGLWLVMGSVTDALALGDDSE